MVKIIDFNKRPADDADKVLEEAKGAYKDVCVIGYNENGELDIRASIGMSEADIIMAFEEFKYRLFSGDYADSD